MRSSARTNHSHVCGINVLEKLKEQYPGESFPRMWDQRLGTSKRRLPRRIIPTYVGSTLPRFRRQLLQTNHSHVCGINATEPAAIANHFESFPRMWDQLGLCGARAKISRIIPTYVGSTTVPVCVKGMSSNHSHVCGINSATKRSSSSSIESFPRMWDQHNIL